MYLFGLAFFFFLLSFQLLSSPICRTGYIFLISWFCFCYLKISTSVLQMRNLFLFAREALKEVDIPISFCTYFFLGGYLNVQKIIRISSPFHLNRSEGTKLYISELWSLFCAIAMVFNLDSFPFCKSLWVFGLDIGLRDFHSLFYYRQFAC